MVREARHVKIALAEAVNWALNESLGDKVVDAAAGTLKKFVAKKMPAMKDTLKLVEQEQKNIALYPGKFKPPHGGHFNVAKQVAENPDVDKLIIFVSPREHEGISAEQSVEVWNRYLPYN